MQKELILKKYNKKILGVAGLLNYYSDSFIHKDKLLSFLYELDTFEADLTDEGLKFLEEFYGLDKVADYVIEKIKRGAYFKWEEKEDLIAWLKRKGNLHPDSTFTGNN